MHRSMPRVFRLVLSYSVIAILLVLWQARSYSDNLRGTPLAIHPLPRSEPNGQHKPSALERETNRKLQRSFEEIRTAFDAHMRKHGIPVYIAGVRYSRVADRYEIDFDWERNLRPIEMGYMAVQRSDATVILQRQDDRYTGEIPQKPSIDQPSHSITVESFSITLSDAV
jgi:hypothetical protein